jgi:hypothetical protein
MGGRKLLRKVGVTDLSRDTASITNDIFSNLTLPPTPAFPKWSLPFRFSKVCMLHRPTSSKNVEGYSRSVFYERVVTAHFLHAITEWEQRARTRQSWGLMLYLNKTQTYDKIKDLRVAQPTSLLLVATELHERSNFSLLRHIFVTNVQTSSNTVHFLYSKIISYVMLCCTTRIQSVCCE